MKTIFDDPTMQALGDALRQSDQDRMDRMANHPDNGKTGWWIVDGIRHHAYARASSAPEAIAMAENAGLVQSWESPTARFWTEKLPDVF